MRRQHGAAESVDFVPARDGEQRAGGLILENAVGGVEAQITARTVAEVVVEPRRELRLSFIKRKLSGRVGEETDCSRITGRRQRAAQLSGALLQSVRRGAPGDEIEERGLISDRGVLRGGRYLKKRRVVQQVDKRGLLLIVPLNGSEEEGLVPRDRAPEGAAVLLAIEWRFPFRVEIEGVARVELFVVEQTEQASVKTVAAGTGNDVDHASRGSAEFGAEAVSHDLELLHGLLRDHGLHGAGSADGLSAVHRDLVAAPVVASERESRLRRLHDAVIRRVGDVFGTGHAGREQRVIQIVAAVDR